MDLKLTATGDLDITNGELSLVDGLERIRQQCLIRLRTFRGEWFRDQRVGMPYYQEILGIKPFNEALARSRLRAALMGVPGVLDVPEISVSVDGQTRLATVAFSVIASPSGDGTDLFTEEFVLP